MTTKKSPAQIVFIQNRDGNAWIGHLLNPAAARDAEHDLRLAGKIECVIREKPGDSQPIYELVTHGGSRCGRRYRWFGDLTAAQNAAIKWAGRRFKIVTV